MRSRVTRRLTLAGVLVMASAVHAADGRWPFLPPSPAASPAHPAVVRIVAHEQNAKSHGSGTLIHVSGDYALVITNWHVIQDATGPVSVTFADGFESPAQVLKVDRDWDLAALAIWRPNVSPVRIADAAPQIGETLTIAGYGSGQYRAVTGQCTQYVAPGVSLPYEMVELSVAARQGDSGGPIFNSSGELAGVLFGSGHGTTSGSYCGRVQRFLDSVWSDSGVATDQIDVARRPAPLKPVSPANVPLTGSLARVPAAPSGAPAGAHAAEAVSDFNRHSAATARSPGQVRPIPDSPNLSPSLDPPASSDAIESSSTLALAWQDVAGTTLFEQGKTVLAVVGLISVILLLGKRRDRESE